MKEEMPTSDARTMRDLPVQVEPVDEANAQARRFYGDAFRAVARPESRAEGVMWFRAFVVDKQGRYVPTAMERGGLYRTERDAYDSLTRGLRAEPDSRAEANREAVRVYGSYAWVSRDEGHVRVFCHAPRGEEFVDELCESDELCEADTLMRLTAALRGMPNFPEDGEVSEREAADLVAGLHQPPDLPPSLEMRLCRTVLAQARELAALRAVAPVSATQPAPPDAEADPYEVAIAAARESYKASESRRDDGGASASAAQLAHLERARAWSSLRATATKVARAAERVGDAVAIWIAQ